MGSSSGGARASANPNGPGDRSNPSAPSTPSTPAPAGPATGGPAPATAPTPSAPATPGGYVPKTRGPSTREVLTIDWDHPVPPKHEPQIGTFAIKKCALPLEQALAIVSGDDPRPLLVVRECARCAGTEDALLSRVEDNERTFLMSRWFHCVKLPPQVTEPDHPFHNLFAGENPEHLFVSRADGSLRRELGRDRSLAGLWKSMRDVLAAEYRDDPGVALTQLAKILDRFDELDGRIFDLQRRIERAGEDEGPSSKQLVKLRGDLAVLNARRDELRADVVRSSKLARREPEPVAANKSG